MTVLDSYPLPNMLDFSERIAGCTIFSKVDLRKGDHQILMQPGDIDKTAIATPFGLFEFLRMTVGQRRKHLPAADGLAPFWAGLRIRLPG